MSAPKITFLEENAPVDEYGRALYAVARSVLRAFIDSMSNEDMTDLNTPLEQVRMRQLAKVARVELDHGMRGDGFEWAVHEAILGQEPRVIEPLAEALSKVSKYVRKAIPRSLLFGHERARYLGFMDAVVTAGERAYLLPEGSGRPFLFGPWVSKAARGKAAEPELKDRIRHIWKTDLFLSAEDDPRYFAATVKSNFSLLEGGKGLRIGIVPESSHRRNPAGIRYSNKHELWVVSLADPNGFMGLFNDGYAAVARAMCTLGKHPMPPFWTKPSAKAQRVQEQLERYPDAPVIEIEGALNHAAQRDLISVSEKLVSVNAPDWLHIKECAPRVISPKPRFNKLD